MRSRVVITAFILSSLAWLRPASSARAHVVHSFALHPDGQDQIAVAISGTTVVWAERTGPQAPWGSRANLYAEDLRARTPRLLARHIALVAEPDNLELSGRTAVWLDCRACRRTNGLPGYSDLTLQAIDLRNGNQLRIAGGPIDHPAISGRLVVWDAIVHGARLLRAEDIRTGRVVSLRRLGFAPSISGDVIAFLHATSHGEDVDAINLRTGRTVTLYRATRREVWPPSIDRQRVVWARETPDAKVVIEGIDLARRHRFVVTTISANHFNPQLGPDVAIKGSTVVWVQSDRSLTAQNPQFTLHGADLRSGASFRFPNKGSNQLQPAMSNRAVVWIQQRQAYHSPGVAYAAPLPLGT